MHVMDLPPGVASRARRVAVASTVATAATTATVGSSRRRCITTCSRGTTVATPIAALRSTTPASTKATAAATSTATHATNIASSCVAATTASTTATTTTPKASTFASNALEEAGNFLVGLLEQLEEVSNNTTIATVEERGGDTSISGTTCTTNAVYVVVDVGRQVVVDDVSDLVIISKVYGEGDTVPVSRTLGMSSPLQKQLAMYSQ
jgi:hypothetical protein